LRQSPLNHLMT